MHCCDIFCQVLTLRLSFCLPGRFLSCLEAVGSTRGILKSLCKCFLGGAVSIVFKVEVGGTSCSARGASGMMTGICLGDLARSSHSVGQFGVGGRCMAGSGQGSPVTVVTGYSVRVS